MTSQAKSSHRKGLWLFSLWHAPTVTTFAPAYWGWYDQATGFKAYRWRAHENAAFMAIRAFGSDQVRVFDAGMVDWLERFVAAQSGQPGLAAAGELRRPERPAAEADTGLMSVNVE